MQKRRIESCQIEVSIVGLGTVKLGRNQGVKYPSAFTLPTDKAIEALLDEAKALDINLLDTAPAYGTSEERLGKLIHRDDWIISTKVGEEFDQGVSHFDFSPAAIQKSIDRSLKRLKTDYLDIVLVHSNGDDVQLIQESHVFEILFAMKESGKIRAYGMSTKTVAGGLLTVDHADIAMVTHNPAYTDEQSVIAYAEEKQKGIFIKKAFGSGHLSPKECLPFILATPGVSSIILGTINPLHLRENVGYVV